MTAYFRSEKNFESATKFEIQKPILFRFIVEHNIIDSILTRRSLGSGDKIYHFQ